MTQGIGVVLAVAVCAAAAAAQSRAVTGQVRLDDVPLAEAVVFLEPFESTVTPTPVRGRVNQRDLAFVPRILAVPTGSVVEFPNSDPFLHNVFHPGPGSDAFDLGTYPSSEVRTVEFDKPGLFVLLCHVHPEMVGYVAAVPSAWYAVTTEQGRFDIEGVPPGSYRLRVWHRRTADPALAVAVRSEGMPPITVNVTRRSRRGIR